MNFDDLNLFLKEIKLNFLLYEPFIGTALTYIDINENNNFNICNTLCCYFNNKTLRFNIDYNIFFLKSLNNKDEILAVFKHEVLHILNKHFLRMDIYNKKHNTVMNLKYANIAMDIAINQYIDNLPSLALSYKLYNLPNGLDFESYYDLLMKNINNKNNIDDSIKKLNKEKADCLKETLNTSDKKEQDKLKKKIDDINKELNKLKNEKDKDEQEKNEKDKEKELIQKLDDLTKKLEDDKINDKEKDKIEKQMDNLIKDLKPDEHKEFIKNDENDMNGENLENSMIIMEEITKNIVNESFKRTSKDKIPGYRERLKKVWKREEKVVNWKKITKQFIEKTLLSNEKEETWFKPNKRFADVKGRRKINELEILIAIDTSMSISRTTVLNFLNEIQLIDKNINATVIYFHTYVYNVMKGKKEWKNKEKYSKIVMGGTLFQPIFDFAKKNNLKRILILTDGDAEKNINSYNIKSLWIDDKKTKLCIINKSIINGNGIFKNYKSKKI